MKNVKISFDESKIFKKRAKRDLKKRFAEKKSKSYIFIILFLLLILNYIIIFYLFKKVDKQNKTINNLLNNTDKVNEKYNKSVQQTLISLNYFKETLNQNNNNPKKTYYLEKLIKKVSNTNSLTLLNNYLELDNLFKDDKRYDGARNCLVEAEPSPNCIYNYLYPKRVIGKTRKLYGGKVSTSYVMLEEFEGIKIAYSIGIGDPGWYIAFDKELADRNIDVYMYDHTTRKLPYPNPRFHFHKIGLTGKNNNNPSLKYLEDILRENGHLNEKNMILKIDCEYCEWESLIDFPEEILKNFRFMLLELHFNNRYVDMYPKVLAKLSKYHQIFYVHCVNCGHVVHIGDIRICDALEVSYVIKEGHQFEKDDSIYPVDELNTICDKRKKLDFNENIFKYFDY